MVASLDSAAHGEKIQNLRSYPCQHGAYLALHPALHEGIMLQFQGRERKSAARNGMILLEVILAERFLWLHRMSACATTVKIYKLKIELK